jgi:hypothetical protein
MSELIVMIACLYNKGCQQAGSAYYNSNPSLQELISSSETKAKQLAGPYVVEYAAPMTFMLLGQDAFVKIDRNYSVKLYDNNVTLKYIKEW